MNPRNTTAARSALPSIACAAALALVGIGLLTVASPHATPATVVSKIRVTAPAAPPRPPHTTAPATATSPTSAKTWSAPTATPTTGAPASELPPPGSGAAGDPAIQGALDAASPTDLPAQVSSVVVDLGRQVWTAEATGTGRQRWPAYFPHSSTGPGWVYTHFRIQAAIARRDPQATGRAVVRLVWAGADPTGQFLDDRTATVTFTRTGETWTPLR